MREFWVRPNIIRSALSLIGHYICWDEKYPDDTSIHVIEYSAYENALGWLEKRNETIQERNKQLAAAKAEHEKTKDLLAMYHHPKHVMATNNQNLRAQLAAEKAKSAKMYEACRELRGVIARCYGTVDVNELEEKIIGPHGGPYILILEALKEYEAGK